MPKHTNKLIASNSPYLLQHAHNPVNWEEWSKAPLQRAKVEDKPILVSIGYSSCHWCHVMERESFEDEAIAKVMNKQFVCIKVDREERPDVDDLYMDAVHAMGLQGGWPLNVFLTPEQKPFYGGTYFPRNGWMELLLSVTDAFKTKREKIDESADAFTQHIKTRESEKYKLENRDHKFSSEESTRMFLTLQQQFDLVDGGLKRSPKFPMPAIWQYVGLYGQLTKDSGALHHFHFTLQNMADGGIYDHVGGGFARYSTDSEWHVPHFEKMLYDNGQLLSLFATGYKFTKDVKFKTVLLETVSWLEREMLDPSGGFYSALDADSEGEEGKFYVWSATEIDAIAGKDSELIKAYFDVQDDGNWDGTNVLRLTKPEIDLAAPFNLSTSALQQKISEFKQNALQERNKRIQPGLDNKIIASWNGLALTGLIHSYQALGDPDLLNLAKKNAAFIKEKLVVNDRLRRFSAKEMEGFLEDYAAVIQSFILYYETTMDRDFLETARSLLLRAREVFYDSEEELFNFSANDSDQLIAGKKELFDNVIPSSNSMMAWNLIHLGTHFYDDDNISLGKKMLSKVKQLMLREPSDTANWATLATELNSDIAEIIIVGKDASEIANEMNSCFIPNKIIAASEQHTGEEPFLGKIPIDDQTTIYVCYNKSCHKPVFSSEEALNQLQKP